MRLNLSDRQIRNLRDGMLAAGIFCFAVAAFLYSNAHAVELSITGLSNGTGLHSISLSGDCLNATLQQGLNSSSWNVTAVVPV